MTPGVTFGLECHECGGLVFEREEPVYYEDETMACPECGVIHRVTVDEDNDGNLTAYASTDEHAADIGQPKCHNECGRIHVGNPAIAAEFLGQPCRWNCEKSKAAGVTAPIRKDVTP